MEKLNKETHQITITGENEKKEMDLEQRSYYAGLTEQFEKLEATQLTHVTELLFIHHDDQKYEDFRSKCESHIARFTTFKRLFDAEKCSIYTTRDDIENNVELSDPPDLSDALLALQELEEGTFKFQLDGIKDSDKYKEILQKVKEIILKLRDVLTEIEASVGRYKPNFGNESKTEIRKMGIKKDCKKTEKLVNELNDVITKFNLPVSNKFEEKLADQIKELSISTSKTVDQITKGLMPSTSGATYRIEEGPSELGEESD